MRNILISFVLLVFFVGCGYKKLDTASKVPYAQELKIDNIYVAKSKFDTRNSHKLIAEILNEEGFKATYGELEDMPKNTDALITYMSRWTNLMSSFFIPYLAKIDIVVRNPQDNFPYASSNYVDISDGFNIHKSILEDALEKLLKTIKDKK